MVTDALIAANDALCINGYKMSELPQHIEWYHQLDDRILYLIETSTTKELRKAREIVQRIHCTPYYKSIGHLYFQKPIQSYHRSKYPIDSKILTRHIKKGRI